MSKATEAKSFLEHRQRQEAKERAEKSEKWQTKVNIFSSFVFLTMVPLVSSSFLRHPVNKNGPTAKN